MDGAQAAVKIARSHKGKWLGFALAAFYVLLGMAGLALQGWLGRWDGIAFVFALFVIVGLLIGGLVRHRAAARGPGLVIDARGITDYTRLSGMRALPWEHIAGFMIRKSAPPSEGNLFVLVRDFDRYVASLPGHMQSRLRDGSPSQPSPFFISIDQLETDGESLLQLLNRHQKLHQPGRSS